VLNGGKNKIRWSIEFFLITIFSPQLSYTSNESPPSKLPPKTLLWFTEVQADSRASHCAHQVVWRAQGPPLPYSSWENSPMPIYTTYIYTGRQEDSLSSTERAGKVRMVRMVRMVRGVSSVRDEWCGKWGWWGGWVVWERWVVWEVRWVSSVREMSG